MTKFGYQDLSDLSNVKVNTKPLKDTETIMTLTNPHNDKKIIIEYDKTGTIIRIIAPSHKGDIEFIKYDNSIAFMYINGENTIDIFRFYHIDAHSKDTMVFTYDKSFNLMMATNNGTLIGEYIK